MNNGEIITVCLSESSISALADAIVRRIKCGERKSIDARTACEILGVSRRTLYNYSKKYPQISIGSRKFSREQVLKLNEFVHKGIL